MDQKYIKSLQDEIAFLRRAKYDKQRRGDMKASQDLDQKIRELEEELRQARLYG